MNLDQIQRRLSATREGLRHLAGLEQLDDTQAREFDWLDAEERWLADQEQTVARREERRTAVLDQAQSGRGLEPAVPQIQRKVDPFTGDDVRSLRPMEARDRALSALDSRELTRHLQDDQKEQVERLLRAPKTRNYDPDRVARMVLLTESEQYREAFRKVVTQPTPVLTSEEARALQAYDEFRAMSIGTDSAGGFGVPVFIDPSIVLTAQGSNNPFPRISRVETITNDEWKGVSSAGVTWSFDAEATEVSDDSPTLAQPNVVAHKAQGFIPYSIEVGGDYPGFAEEMSRLLVEGYDELLAEKLATGSGTNEPFGIITALDANTNVEVVVTTDGAFGVVDVYKVWKELPERYRDSASWVMNVDVNNEVRQFGDDKLHPQTVNLTERIAGQVFGRPVYESAHFPEFTGTTGAANILVVGDFRNYLIAQRLGMTVELVPHLIGTNRRPTGQRGWYAYARVGADSINDLGFRILQNQ